MGSFFRLSLFLKFCRFQLRLQNALSLMQLFALNEIMPYCECKYTTIISFKRKIMPLFIVICANPFVAHSLIHKNELIMWIAPP